MRRTASTHPTWRATTPSQPAYGELLRFAASFTKDFSAIVPSQWVPGLVMTAARGDRRAAPGGPASCRVACVGGGTGASAPAWPPSTEVRQLAASPIWLAIGDRRAAFIAPASGHHRGRAWITTDSDDVRTAKGFFELAWCGARRGSPARATERRSAVLLCLARGLTDAAIAKRLNVTDRTVRREISSLMRDTGSTTRFQLGLRTALGGVGLPSLALPPGPADAEEYDGQEVSA
ncbi:helix-turn-helix domain-containing protein [Streptomonospora nanhaiensis]|uniref:helix-turn-helix transcriptional regulator n=1 Tax=Streptomonospora nanhaiensis TaxID=1323731 RepID=UPI001C993401|nr:helix-turn-helix transcriptional regulator [Streptomonospora nanhaiensis]MBX9391079.1 helix-turn-helix transcriptional regulator [Streptomonospora nanhaiensis]